MGRQGGGECEGGGAGRPEGGAGRPEGAGGGDPLPDGPFRAVLTTVGRSTGAEHSVELLAVAHAGRIYFSRHRPDSDWFRNAARNPSVRVRIGPSELAGAARVVDDDRLAATVSALKYPGQGRASEKRVAIEVTLGGRS